MKDKSLLLVDNITFFSFFLIVSLGIVRRPIKVLCGSPPVKTGFGAHLQRFLLRYFDFSLVFYDHLDLHGLNIPEVLIERFGELKDNVNERSYVLCEKLFDQAIAPSKTYGNLSGLFGQDRKVKNLFRKVLLSYCKVYVSLLECGRLEAAHSDAEFSRVYLIGSRDVFNATALYLKEFKPFDANVQEIGKQCFFLWNWLWGLTASVAAPVYMLWQISRRLTFTQEKSPSPKTIWLSTGINYRFLTDFFSETSTDYTSALHIRDALFLKEGPDTGQMSKYADENGIEMVDVKRAPIGMSYFFCELLIITFGVVFAKQFVFSLLGEGSMVCWKAIYIAVMDKINFEVLSRKYGVRLYLTARHYGNDAAKVMAINKLGGQSVGFQFGDASHPMTNLFIYAYTSLNHFFVYGKKLDDLKACGQIVDAFHAVGSDRMDAFFKFKDQQERLLERYNPEKAFVITVFGPAYNETIPRHRNVLKFYQSVFTSFLSVIDKNVKLIIKVHKKSNMADEEKDFPELASVIDLFRTHKKVLYYYYENPYALLSISDMVITWSSSTTGLEAIAAGKPTVFMDPMKSKFLVYGRFHPSIVVGEKEELQKLVVMAVDGAYPVSQEIYSDIVKNYCSPNDGRAFQRTLDTIGELYTRLSVHPEKP